MADVTTGTGRLFANQTYHYETLRALGYVPSGGAEVNEVLETVKRITEGDAHSWYAEWSAATERVRTRAEQTRDPISKGHAFLRAHNYQRTGEFLLAPDDPERPPSRDRTLAYFYQGLDALGVPYERVAASYEAGQLRALYLPGPDGAARKPLIVAVGGFDSILEELYFVLGKAAVDRGYAVLLYEGPGQGEALRRHGLTFTHEWERPTSAVIDAFLAAHATPSAIVLVGMSMGGYLAPRAAAFDSRIDGVVAFDTAFDMTEMAAHILAAASNPTTAALPDIVWAYDNARWTLGTGDIASTKQAFEGFTLAPVADRIRQDVLILAGVADHFIPTHQTGDFEKALVNARSVTTRTFDRVSGGAEHCQAGALSLVYAELFDWLTATFPETRS